jgi:hypothetical protein
MHSTLGIGDTRREASGDQQTEEREREGETKIWIGSGSIRWRDFGKVADSEFIRKEHWSG